MAPLKNCLLSATYRRARRPPGRHGRACREICPGASRTAEAPGTTDRRSPYLRPNQQAEHCRMTRYVDVRHAGSNCVFPTGASPLSTARGRLSTGRLSTGSAGHCWDHAPGAGPGSGLARLGSCGTSRAASLVLLQDRPRRPGQPCCSAHPRRTMRGTAQGAGGRSSSDAGRRALTPENFPEPR